MLAGCLVLLAAVVARSVQLQVVAHAQYVRLANGEHLETLRLHASRGSIVDARGLPLALSEQATTVGAYVPLADPEGVAKAVASALSVSPNVVYARLTTGHRGHVDLVRQADPSAAARLEAAHVSTLLTFVPEEKRIYPLGTATPIIGTTDIDGHGLAGLERSYDRSLRGHDGSERFTQSGTGATISPIALAPARDGARLQLALDLQVQAAAERTVASTQRRTHARSVLAIVLDVRDGGVLAMASTPAAPAGTTYGDASADDVRLRALADQYEPGSTFKTATIAAGLDRGVITPRTRFTIPGCLTLYNRRICDAERHGTESMSVTKILTVSSNVGAVKIAYEKLSGRGAGDHGKYFAPYIARFGFGAPTGIDLPGELRGFVPDYRSWSGTSIGNIPFGQGIGVTPLQIATFYAMVANGGMWTQPHVVERVDGVALPVVHRRMLSARIAGQLNSMLRRVVSTGTGVKAAIAGYAVAGKTGTTQKVVNGTYSKEHYVGWFVGFAPAAAPRVVTLILVDDPGTGSYYGGDTAAPAFADLTTRALQALGVRRR
jgi:cell division protein FtsI (penicillin-binding protein 3)/stage V sporulation protein D (sporulation-specific penicillin-binding protein)